MPTLGQNIMKFRIDKRMKQKDLCESTGLPQRYVSLVENDYVDPRLSIIQKIAKGLGVHPALLLEGLNELSSDTLSLKEP